MDKSRDRKGVLIFVAPRSHKFAVIGDEFWCKLAQAMTDYFKKLEFTPSIIHGVQQAGALLAEHFQK